MADPLYTDLGDKLIVDALDNNPTTGLAAPIGSLALTDAGVTYLKTGSADTAWTALATVGGASGLPRDYFKSDVPTFTSTSVSITSVSARDTTNTTDITLASATASLTTSGIGGIIQSANLTGTATVSAATVTGTGTNFTTDFKAGDIFTAAGSSSRILTVNSNTSITLAYSHATSGTNVVYQRGGRAKSAAYFGYVNASGLFLSTRSLNVDSPVDFPSGFYRQTDIVLLTDDSANIRIPKIIGWGNNPRYLDLSFNLVSNGQSTTAVDIPMPNLKIGKTVDLIVFWGRGSTGSTASTFLRPKGFSVAYPVATTTNSNTPAFNSVYWSIFNMPTGTDGLLQYYWDTSANNGGFYLDLVGFTVTERT